MKENSILRNKKVSQQKNFFPWMMILPTVIILAVFSIYPIVRSFGFSLTDYGRGNLQDFQFTGLQNFIEIFKNDKVFWKSLGNSVKWVGLEVGLQLVFGMIFALILNRQFIGKGFVRTFSFAPWAVSGILTTMLWLLVFNEHFGLLNNVLKMIGLGQYAKAWVANPNTAFSAVAVAELWRGIPFFTISLLGGLQTVPESLYEAAKVDGASHWRTFWSITLPSIRESIVFATLMRMIWEFRSVDLIISMTNGGPINRTLTLPIYMFQQSIENGRYGYGSALTVILFLILSLYAAGFLKINNFGKGVNE